MSDDVISRGAKPPASTLAGDLPFSRCFFNFLPLSRLWSWYSRFGLAKPSAPCAKARASEHARSIDDRECVRGRRERVRWRRRGVEVKGHSWLSQGHTV